MKAAKLDWPWPVCPYCGNPAEFVTGLVIYPHRHDLAGKYFYRCLPCDARVGVHRGTRRPYGKLANRETREWRGRAHAVFDPIWEERLKIKQLSDPKYNRAMARGGRYKKLARLMGMSRVECHIGNFTIEQCELVVEICKAGQLEGDLQ